MSRPLRIQYPGAIYHITSRGNNRQPIFGTDDDRFHFLRILAKTVERFQWVCSSFSLMTNHYHFVIRTLLPNLSQGMRYLNGTYTIDYNRSHKTVGHLFQGRFTGILVEDGKHWLELCRYVILNPVRAGICSKPEDYLWSSYRSTIGLAPCPPFLTIDPILKSFHADTPQAIPLYREFVENGYDDLPWDRLKNGAFYGSDDFIKDLRDMFTCNAEVSPQSQQVSKPSLTSLLSSPNGIWHAYQQGYTQRQIAEELNCHYRTISRRLEEIEKGRGQV